VVLTITVITDFKHVSRIYAWYVLNLSQYEVKPILTATNSYRNNLWLPVVYLTKNTSINCHY